MRMILCSKCAAHMSENHDMKSDGGSRKDNCQRCRRVRLCIAWDIQVEDKA